MKLEMKSSVILEMGVNKWWWWWWNPPGGGGKREEDMIMRDFCSSFIIVSSLRINCYALSFISFIVHLFEQYVLYRVHKFIISVNKVIWRRRWNYLTTFHNNIDLWPSPTRNSIDGFFLGWSPIFLTNWYHFLFIRIFIYFM